MAVRNIQSDDENSVPVNRAGGHKKMGKISNERWIDGLEYSSLFWPTPDDFQQREAQINAYVDYFGQFISDQFPEDIAELIRSRYPTKVKRLLDDVLAKFVLNHPEHGHTVLHPIISRIINGTLVYDKTSAPFSTFISLVCLSNENEYSEQWALACWEILRELTHYNRPIYKSDHHNNDSERSSSGSHATTSRLEDDASQSPVQQERRPSRPLSPWITDILLVAPLAIRTDYFRWCAGVMGEYTTGEELKPPSSACVRGSGKHPQLMPLTPRWAIANGAGVILSVCDEEVSRYETATLTGAAVPALLLPPPTTALNEHLFAGLPALEPYARLFHRYYANAMPSATHGLLLGILQAPPSWAPDALDAVVQLVELLRAAEEYTSGMRLQRNWLHLHFLHAIGTALSMRNVIAADTAAALLFRILSQPAVLFPPPRHGEAVENENESHNCNKKQIEVPKATVETTAQGIASMFCAYGPEVEWRICTIWEAAYGLIPLSSSSVDLPEIVVACPLQPPILSWNLYFPLLKVLEYLPRGSPSEACLMRIFVATVEAILFRTFPPQSLRQENRKSGHNSGNVSISENLAVAELHTMIHSLFLEACPSMELSSRLLFVVLTVCLNHEARPQRSKRTRSDTDIYPVNEVVRDCGATEGKQREMEGIEKQKKGPVEAFDSYVTGAICGMSTNLFQLFPLMFKPGKGSDSQDAISKLSASMQNAMCTEIRQTRKMLGILEALFSLKPSSVGTSWSFSSNEIIAAAVVAAHISEFFRRSKASLHSLSLLVKCKWDNNIHKGASSLYNLIDIHGRVVASIINKAGPLEAELLHSPLWSERRPAKFTKHSMSENFNKCKEASLSCEREEDSDRKPFENGEMEASELANYLTKDRHIGFSCSAELLLRTVLAKKQELCFSVVSLLWDKLVASPETQLSEKSTSAQQGWRQVVDALCNVVAVSPVKASAAIILQAEKDMQPWIARNDEQGQMMWIINQRILKLIVELMRNHDNPESWVIIANALDLLLRATDGMLIDGEACTLPQLELLEVTAQAIRQVPEWGNIGSPVIDSLSDLLKCRLSAITKCLSHPNALIRVLSMSVLREILGIEPFLPSFEAKENINDINVSEQKLNPEFVNWREEIEKCFTWEVKRRHASQLVTTFLNEAKREFSFTISS